MNKSVIQSLYDSESSNYLASRRWMKSYVFQRTIKQISLWLQDFGKDCVILNVGCGPGWLEEFVWQNHNNLNCIALDISKKMALSTKKQVPHFDIIVADAEALPFRSGSLDVIFSGRAIKWFDVSRFLSEANRVLTEGGSIGLFFDCGDALWVQFLEWLGMGVDVGCGRRTMRTSYLALELGRLNFEELSVTPIAIFSPLVFSIMPSSLYGILSFFDRPIKRGRFTFIAGKKARKEIPDKEENV